MAPTTTLPPQAYTREHLSKAYLWIQSQPDSIRKMANTPDALVGLYLRAQRNGDTSLEAVAPVSRTHFMNDLKSLASELEQFDSAPKTQAVAPAPAPPSPPQFAMNSAPSSFISPVQNPAPTNIGNGFILDSKSQELIRDVKEALNLTSESEILRLLIVLGHERAKSIFPSKS